MEKALKNIFNNAMADAIEMADEFRGATAPNPCVGAAALTEDGKVLTTQAHQRAGTFHAEARVIDELQKKNLLSAAHTLLVTLEPCNHQGRTPACSEAIVRAHQEHGAFKRVIFACPDLNKKVAGHGGQMLALSGIEVHCLESEDPTSTITQRAQELLAPFVHWSQTHRPWITVKRAFDSKGSMIPPTGEKTFTSHDSLVFAHQLRKRADAILTGSGTILADDPSFTVRLVRDHPDKKRWLAILDRRQRVSQLYLQKAHLNGFQSVLMPTIEQTLDLLGAQGCLEVLVEAGPTLTQEFVKKSLWNELITIQKSAHPDEPDEITHDYF